MLLSNYGAVISLGFFTPIFALYIVKLGGNIADVGLLPVFITRWWWADVTIPIVDES